MKKILLASAFILTCLIGHSQIVYSVDNQSFADIKVYVVSSQAFADLLVYKQSNQAFVGPNNGQWFFTTNQSFAKKKIFFTDNQAFADLKIFYVDSPNFAGWKNMDKKSLLD